MNKLKLFQERNFSENISFTFQFVKENFIHFFVNTAILTIPLAMILGFISYALLKIVDKINLLNIFLYVNVPFYAWYIFSVCILCNYYLLYDQYGARNFNLRKLLSTSLMSFGRLLIADGILIGILFFANILAIFLPILTPLIYLASLFYGIKLTFFQIIVVREKKRFSDAINETFSISFGRWWEIFGVRFVVGFISILIFFATSYLLSFVITIPDIFGGIRHASSDVVNNGILNLISTVITFSLAIHIFNMLMETAIFGMYASFVGENLKQNIDKLGKKLDNEKDEEEDF
jgi:hypothetical protein